MLDNLSIFLLHVIHRIPRLESQYTIMRFMGKAALLPDIIFGNLQSLVNDGFLEITKIEYGVKYYEITFKGKDWLDRHYSLKEISEYVDTIDSSGFFSKILVDLENSKS